MQSRQRGENEEEDRNEQKRAHPGHPLLPRPPAHHRRGFIMPDKEHLSGRLHGLLKRLANSSYNMPGRKTPCCWQGDSRSAAFLRTPAFPQCPKGAKLKKDNGSPSSCPWDRQGQAGTGSHRRCSNPKPTRLGFSPPCTVWTGANTREYWENLSLIHSRSGAFAPQKDFSRKILPFS